MIIDHIRAGGSLKNLKRDLLLLAKLSVDIAAVTASGRLFSTGQNNIIPGSSKGSTNCNGRYSCVSPVLAEAMHLVSTRTDALFGLLEHGGAPQ
jgi:hypothetical protein